MGFVRKARFQLPDDFALSVNPTLFSNTDKSLKMLQDITTHYQEKLRNIENLVFDYPALLILDIVKGQLTEPVLNELKENHIFTWQVPADMAHIFQPSRLI